MAHMLIGFYTIADTDEGLLKVMRSYQYYAAVGIANIVAEKKSHWDESSLVVMCGIQLEVEKL